jgi:hypothetical protein
MPVEPYDVAPAAMGLQRDVVDPQTIAQDEQLKLARRLFRKAQADRPFRCAQTAACQGHVSLGSRYPGQQGGKSQGESTGHEASTVAQENLLFAFDPD